MSRHGTLTWLAGARTVESDALVLELPGRPDAVEVIPLPAPVDYVVEHVTGFAWRYGCDVREVEPVCG